MNHPKITEHHHSRLAYVYLRQSTPGQVLHHQESTERQYALREKAEELGWNEAAIRTLDRDLGKSGAQPTFPTTVGLAAITGKADEKHRATARSAAKQLSQYHPSRHRLPGRSGQWRPVVPR